MFDWSTFGTVMAVAVVIGLLFAWMVTKSEEVLIDETGWLFFAMYLTVVVVGFLLIVKPAPPAYRPAGDSYPPFSVLR